MSDEIPPTVQGEPSVDGAPPDAPPLLSGGYDEPVLDREMAFDPADDPESWRLTVPAKPACYLLADGEDRPILIATTSDLRSLLLRRLGPAIVDEPDEAESPGDPGDGPEHEDGGTAGRRRKSVDYRSVTRRVRYRIVHSRFEADWAYLESTRRCLPRQARRLTRHLGAHWIAIDPTDPYPRFEAVTQPWTGRPGAIQFGPLPTARIARSCVEALEDAFDLCRNHALLLQTPHAVACAYKQMGRCPAPCDGSVPLSVYLAQLDRAIEVLREAPRWFERVRGEMKRAAEGLQYEAAGAAKELLDRTKALAHHEARMLSPVDRLGWLILQRAGRADRVRLFSAMSGRIVCLGEVRRKRFADHAAETVAEARRAAERTSSGSWVDDDGTAVRLNLAAFHALHADHPAARRGAFIPFESLDEHAVARAVDEVASRPATAPGNE